MLAFCCLKIPKRGESEIRSMSRRKIYAKHFLGREATLGYLLVAPTLAVISCLVAYPFVVAIYLSFTDKIIGRPASFVGLQNFIELFHNSIFWQTVRNSFIYTGGCVSLKFALGIMMALIP